MMTDDDDGNLDIDDGIDGVWSGIVDSVMMSISSIDVMTDASGDWWWQ
jgi:hypothetical protein